MKIKAKNSDIKSMKLSVPLDGIIEIDANGVAEVSTKCGKMLIEGIKGGECEHPAVCFTALLIQGIATSIDALSVGFTIADYNAIAALVCCLVIGVITFFVCTAGVLIGKKFGTCLAGKASIFGGAILILIGLEIFITGIL